jgi:hypothetical protein
MTTETPAPTVWWLSSRASQRLLLVTLISLAWVRGAEPGAGLRHRRCTGIELARCCTDGVSCCAAADAPTRQFMGAQAAGSKRAASLSAMPVTTNAAQTGW